jgi:hypothetical protein
MEIFPVKYAVPADMAKSLHRNSICKRFYADGGEIYATIRYVQKLLLITMIIARIAQRA